MSATLTETPRVSTSTAPIYKIGDSLKVFAQRNHLDLESGDTFAAWAAAKQAAYKAKMTECQTLTPVKITERANYSAKLKLWKRETMLTYAFEATDADRELCEKAFEKSKAQSAKRISEMTSALAGLK